MNNESMLKPALVGAVVMGVFGALSIVTSLGCFCCAWTIGGGILASYMYVKSAQLPVTLGRGAGLGLLTGFMGTLVFALFSIPIFLTYAHNESISEQFRQNMNRMPNLPVETRQMMESLLSSEGFGVIIVICFLLMYLIASSLLSMLGGTIGAALFEKRKAGPPPYAGSNFEPPADVPPPPSAPPSDPQ